MDEAVGTHRGVHARLERTNSPHFEIHGSLGGGEEAKDGTLGIGFRLEIDPAGKH